MKLKNALLLAAAILCVDAVSLTLSYGLVTSGTWLDSFDHPQGWGGAAEFLRACVIAAIAVFWFAGLFKDETRRLLNDRRARHLAGSLLAAAFLTVAVFNYYCLPAGLCETNKIAAGMAFRECYRPYMAYSLYSFTNYVVFGIPLGIVLIYTVIKDLKQIGRQKARVRIRIKRVLNKKSHRVSEVIHSFRGFKLTFESKLARHLWMFLSVTVLCSLEYHFFQSTLSGTAKAFMWASYSIAGIVVIFTAAGFLFYDKAFRETKQRLYHSRLSSKEFEQDYNAVKTFRTFFTHNIAVFFSLAVLNTIPEAHGVMMNMKDLFSG